MHDGCCCTWGKRKAKEGYRTRASPICRRCTGVSRTPVRSPCHATTAALSSRGQTLRTQHSTAQLSSQCQRCAALLWPRVLLLPWTKPTVSPQVRTASSSVVVAQLAVLTNTQQCRPKQRAGFHSPRAAAGFHSPRAGLSLRLCGLSLPSCGRIRLRIRITHGSACAYRCPTVYRRTTGSTNGCARASVGSLRGTP